MGASPGPPPLQGAMPPVGEVAKPSRFVGEWVSVYEGGGVVGLEQKSYRAFVPICVKIWVNHTSNTVGKVCFLQG